MGRCRGVAALHQPRTPASTADDRARSRPPRHPSTRLLLVAAPVDPARGGAPVRGAGAQPAVARADRHRAVAAGAPPDGLAGSGVGRSRSLGDAAGGRRDGDIDAAVQLGRSVECRVRGGVHPHPRGALEAGAGRPRRRDGAGSADPLQLRRRGRRTWAGVSDRSARAGAPPSSRCPTGGAGGRWCGLLAVSAVAARDAEPPAGPGGDVLAGAGVVPRGRAAAQPATLRGRRPAGPGRARGAGRHPGASGSGLADTPRSAPADLAGRVGVCRAGRRIRGGDDAGCGPRGTVLQHRAALPRPTAGDGVALPTGPNGADHCGRRVRRRRRRQRDGRDTCREPASPRQARGRASRRPGQPCARRAAAHPVGRAINNPGVRRGPGEAAGDHRALAGL